MPELWFDGEADRALSALERDRQRRELARRIQEALDALTTDEGDPRLRRRRFSNGLWCVIVHGDEEDWAILWETHRDRDDVVLVQYIGPSTF